MCGIVGVCDRMKPQQARQLLDRLLATMEARGPDGAGQYIQDDLVMGMRRLAVIDVKGGGQPLLSCDGQVVAFQNGEIYNHAELRRELERCGARFKTSSDTEVLAHGYDYWGMEGLLAKLDGMYALAILDRRTRRLHLARDRFGEKPLFYSRAGEKFAYSSNIIALALLPWVDLDIDLGSVDRYLALHYVPGRRTIFTGIHRLLPGERLTLSLDAFDISREMYYRPRLTPVEPVEPRDLLACIESAVTSRLVADVPVGVFLSGGIDSSIVAAVAAKHHPAIDTFSMGFKDARFDESAHAQAVAHAVGASHHHFTFDETAFHELLPTVVEALDEPNGDQALLPTYWLCREAKRHVTVVLSGEGADELFAGYAYYETMLTRRSWRFCLKEWIEGRAAAVPLQWLCQNIQPVTPSGFPLVMDAAGRGRLLGESMPETDPWEESFRSMLTQAGSSLQRATLADVLTWLPDDLLVKLDRMAMANSLEGRAPFLSPALAEIALRLPEPQRMTTMRSKVVLREVAALLLPPNIVQRRKQGFVLPMERWLRQWLARVGSLRSYFDLSRIPAFNTAAAVSLIEWELALSQPNERLLFALVMLAEWHHSFFRRLRL
ncbi:MAG: Asparagine synthetase [glutamine-hydrolyzing] [Nitrospira sp.]|jgi:asparagine synthase (glutamine-hydrolysing)|nr:MAG: Asparagine synthetase [glutamine-hydrolyzing] [Nitrospira sp.]